MTITLDGPFGWVTLVAVVIFNIAMVKVYMTIANFIGERLGIGRFVLYVCHKIKTLFIKLTSRV